MLSPFPCAVGCWACRQSAMDKVDTNFCKAFSEPFANVPVDRIKKGGCPPGRLIGTSDKCLVSPGRRSVMSALGAQCSALFNSAFVIDALNEDTKEPLDQLSVRLLGSGFELALTLPSPRFKFCKILFFSHVKRE